jgi:hypothetical protein
MESSVLGGHLLEQEIQLSDLNKKKKDRAIPAAVLCVLHAR